MNELTKSGNVITWKVHISTVYQITQESSCFQIQSSKCCFVFYTGYISFHKNDRPLSLSIFFVDRNKLNPPIDITGRVILPSETVSIPRQTITGEFKQMIWSSFDTRLSGSFLTFEIIIHDPGMTDVVSLSEDFKKMLQDGIHHDLILKVGDKEIRAHKDVLRARSPVFKSMLEHDMKEKNSGVIDVPDCDPQAMEVFLLYVYSGKVDAINANNMLQLYYIADKYQMIDLKNECSNFIKRSLSPTNLCGVIQLALNHSDTGLLNVATEYFNNNMLDVLQTVEWQAFMKDNATVANELLIKFHKNKK